MSLFNWRELRVVFHRGISVESCPANATILEQV